MDKLFIMLIGPQGSGKSHYCRTVLNTVEPKKAGPGKIVRISQDDLGKRAHIDQFLDCLKAGHSVVLDRINHTRSQRTRYTDAARQAGYKIKFVWFDVDKQTCLQRLAFRTDHPTIDRDGDNHERILSCYFRDFEPPQYFEYNEMQVVEKKKFATILDLRDKIGDRRCIVVGDIHGCFDEFSSLLSKLNYSADDIIVSVGDLMDRGPKSREVIEWFMSHPNAFAVEGNHDNKARRYWSGRRVKIANGLDKTIEQCEGMDTAAVAAWIETWPQIIRIPDLNGKPTYVVHAGVDGKKPIDRQPAEICLYARYFGGTSFLDESGEVWFLSLDGSYNVASGHMIHRDMNQVDCAFLLDGGAYQGGELRALVVENGQCKIESVQSKDYQMYDNEPIPDEVAARDMLVEQRLLRCDDKGDLRVYTYTDNCTYESAWNDTTLNSRGIILNRKTGEVVARPFSKFFNVGEREETMERNLPWNEPFIVFEKMDGWLGTLYRHEGQYCIATRGSFDGEGTAIWATDHLRKNHNLEGLPDDVTLVFEIICPKTHIIVNYGYAEKLVLLAAFNRHTGEEYAWTQVTTWAQQFNFSIPRVFDGGIEGCRQLLQTCSGTESEGFVIRFQNGLRVKMKGTDYVRRAAILSNLTPLSIWKAMRDNTLTADYRNAVDDDYLPLFDELVNKLETTYQTIFVDIYTEFASLYVGEPKIDEPRKDFAMRVQSRNLKHPKAMFSVLDGKQQAVRKYILGLIRPDGNVMDNELIK